MGHFQVLHARYHDEQNEDYGRECSPTLGSGGKTLQPDSMGEQTIASSPAAAHAVVRGSTTIAPSPVVFHINYFFPKLAVRGSLLPALLPIIF